jgi:hypothetical protein
VDTYSEYAQTFLDYAEDVGELIAGGLLRT